MKKQNTINIISSLAITFAALLVPQLSAQTIPPAIQWSKAYGGSDEDVLFDLKITTDGGCILCGWTQSADGDVTGFHGTTDEWIVKLDAAGNMQWKKCYGGMFSDFAYSIQQTTDGGYVVGGWTNSTDGDVTCGGGAWIVKLDPSGAIQWQSCLWQDKNHGTVGQAYSIEQTPDGGYIVAGSSDSSEVASAYAGSNYALAKLDAGGNVQWQKSYGGNGDDAAWSVEQTRDGGYIVAGRSNSKDGDVTGNHGGYDYWIVKTDAAGNLQWQKSLGGSGDDLAWDIRQTGDGGYIVSGTSNSSDGDVTNPGGGTVGWIVKLDGKGKIQWERSYTFAGGGGSIEQTSDDGYIVGGGGIVKIDGKGNVEWQTGNIQNDSVGVAWVVHQTADGGYIVGGSTDADQAIKQHDPGADYWAAKLGAAFPRISSAKTLNYDSVMCFAPKTDTLWVHDTGGAPLVITADSIVGRSISGQNSKAFTLISPAALPDTVAPGDSLPFVVSFNPTTQPKVIPYSDTLLLANSDAQHNPWLIHLTSVADTENFILDLFVPQNGWTEPDTLDMGTVACAATSKDTSFPLMYYAPLPTSFRMRTSDPVFTVPGYITFDSLHANHQAPVPLAVQFTADKGAGRYIARVFFTDTCGHTDSAYLLVTVTGADVAVAAPPDTAICAGDSVTLTASGGFTSYQWSDGETTQTIIVKASGTYTVTATNANGCSGNSAPVTITVGNTITPVITGTSGFCPGDSATLDAGTGYDSYLWNTGATTETIIVKTAGTYSVSVTKGTCAGTSGNFTVTEYPQPTVTITTSGDTLISSPAASYQWSLNGTAIPGATTQKYVPLTQGNYTVTITDVNGCTGTSSAYQQGALTAELCATTPAPVLPGVLIDMPVTLSNTIIAPVDSLTFDLLYDPTALLYETATSALCNLTQQRIRPGEVHITLANCGAPVNAGDIADMKFAGLISSRDTIYTQVTIDSVMFYPTGSIAGSGCSIPVTINPLCGLKGVIYTGVTSLSQNYPNPFTNMTTIRVTLSQGDAQNAQLKVYNMLGEQVADLTSELSMNADIPFTAEGSKTGVYYYVLQTASGRITRQMFVVK